MIVNAILIALGTMMCISTEAIPNPFAFGFGAALIVAAATNTEINPGTTLHKQRLIIVGASFLAFGFLTMVSALLLPLMGGLGLLLCLTFIFLGGLIALRARA